MKSKIDILILDDNKIDLFINHELIKHSKIEANIKEFSIPFEALKYLETASLNEWPDLIILDIHMPLMNGFEFLKKYNDLPLDKLNKCKVIILSSSLNFQDQNLAKTNPLVIELLEKPLNTDELHNVLVKQGLY